MGRYSGLKAFLSSSIYSQIGGLTAQKTGPPPFLKYYDSNNQLVEEFEITSSTTHNDIVKHLADRGFAPSSGVTKDAPDTSCH